MNCFEKIGFSIFSNSGLSISRSRRPILTKLEPQDAKFQISTPSSFSYHPFPTALAHTDGFLIHGRRARFQILNGEIKPCIYNPMYFACRPFVHASPHAKPCRKLRCIQKTMYLKSDVFCMPARPIFSPSSKPYQIKIQFIKNPMY